MMTTPTAFGAVRRSGRSQWRSLRPGVEWQFEQVVLSRDLSKSAVTRFLVEQADTGGWELDRVRIRVDGTRRVQLRRKIIRQRATIFPIEWG